MSHRIFLTPWPVRTISESGAVWDWKNEETKLMGRTSFLGVFFLGGWGVWACVTMCLVTSKIGLLAVWCDFHRIFWDKKDSPLLLVLSFCASSHFYFFSLGNKWINLRPSSTILIRRFTIHASLLGNAWGQWLLSWADRTLRRFQLDERAFGPGAQSIWWPLRGDLKLTRLDLRWFKIFFLKEISWINMNKHVYRNLTC